MIEHRLDQIVASSKAVIYSAELRSGHATTFISDNITLQLGYEPHEFIDDPTFWVSHIHLDDKRRIFNALNHVPLYGYFAVDYRLRHHDGSYRWVHHDLMCSRDTQGNAIELVGFWMDITEQREMEQALEDSEAKYQDIFEAAHDIIVLMDTDCNILEINHRAEILLGYSKAELLQMNVIENLSTPQDREIMTGVKADLNKGECREYIVRWAAKDERIIHLDGTAAPRFSPAGEVVSIICTLHDITERKQAEEALERSEHRFTTVFANNPVAASISRLEDAQIVDVNMAFVELMGYTREELIGHTADELKLWIAPEDQPNMITTIFEKGTIRTFEMQGLTKSGEVRHLLESAELIDLGDEPHIVIMAFDITERKQAEDELASLYRATAYLFKADGLINLSHQIVKALVHEFAYTDCGLMLVDKATGNIIRLARTGVDAVNTDAPLYLDGLGLVPQAIRTGQVVYTPDVSTSADYATNDPLTRSELVIPLHTINGVLGVLDLQSSKLDAFNQRDQRILVAFAERAADAIKIMQLYEQVNSHAATLEEQVTQRTLQLQGAKERNEIILNNTSDAIVLLSSDGSIKQINRAFSQLFGFISDEIYHQSFESLAIPDQRENLTQVIQSINTTRLPSRTEVAMQDKTGTRFDADVALAPVTDYDGQSSSMICSIRDVTLRKRAEEELRRALKKEQELNELKSSFVSMVSHEFRTPLTVIMTSADIIKRYRDRLSTEKQDEHLSRITAQVYRLTALMNDVLTIGQSDIQGVTAYPELMDMEAFCRNIVDEIQPTAAQHEIQFSFSGNGSYAHSDPKLFRQILYNLISNAIKYSPEANRVQVELSCDQDMAIVRTIDDGIGIPEADQEHLFEVFHRASNVGGIQGTGLGLVIMKQAVDALGGSVLVESQEGVGTTFTIVIPIAERKAVDLLE